MEYRQLGSSTLRISRVGFGCMSLPLNQQAVSMLVEEAVNNGINYFDTADLYDKGENERLLGNALKGKRDKVVIATKVGNEWLPDGSSWKWNPSRSYILQAVEKSLQRLQTSYIDLYQLHGGTMEDPMDETIEAFELLQQQGKILHYGISSIRPNVTREWVKRSNMVSVMLQYSLLDRRPEEEVLPLLKQNQVGVLARGSVAGGLLAGKPARPYLGYSEQEVKALQEALEIKSLQHHPSISALSYVLNHPAVTAAVVGIRTQDHLHQALQAAASPLQDNGDRLFLQQVIPVNRYADHR